MKPIYQDWSQDTLGVSLSVDPLINALLFYPPPSPVHNSGVRGPFLYPEGSRASGTGPRGKAGGQRRSRCWHEAEECAATGRGRGLWAGLQGAECGQALLPRHVPAQVQEGRDVILATGTPQRCASAPPRSSRIHPPRPPNQSSHLTSGNFCRRPATSRPSSMGSRRFSRSRRARSTGAHRTLSSRP